LWQKRYRIDGKWNICTVERSSVDGETYIALHWNISERSVELRIKRKLVSNEFIRRPKREG